ncbi:unnamed protein product [Lactuca virosa]|uniref:Uncharacterized protein n=1 Tax=Lactuca virosa TaxID=75947 RepID=A0AAU9MLS1_9ASTR|nr:unnamed protein product [Lactuca virosa]
MPNYFPSGPPPWVSFSFSGNPNHHSRPPLSTSTIVRTNITDLHLSPWTVTSSHHRAAAKEFRQPATISAPSLFLLTKAGNPSSGADTKQPPPPSFHRRPTLLPPPLLKVRPPPYTPSSRLKITTKYHFHLFSPLICTRIQPKTRREEAAGALPLTYIPAHCHRRHSPTPSPPGGLR